MNVFEEMLRRSAEHVMINMIMAMFERLDLSIFRSNGDCHHC
jgi:hypothetical protein